MALYKLGSKTTNHKSFLRLETCSFICMLVFIDWMSCYTSVSVSICACGWYYVLIWLRYCYVCSARLWRISLIPLQWRLNERNGVSNHRRLDCLLNCLLGRRSKKTSKLWPLWGIHQWPLDFPHKEPVTWKMFPFDDAIIDSTVVILLHFIQGKYAVLPFAVPPVHFGEIKLLKKIMEST